MQLTKETYTISRATLLLVMEQLDRHSTYACDGDEDNDEDVIDARNKLQREIDGQE